jgi:hypothetical protein
MREKLQWIGEPSAPDSRKKTQCIEESSALAHFAKKPQRIGESFAPASRTNEPGLSSLEIAVHTLDFKEPGPGLPRSSCPR